MKTLYLYLRDFSWDETDEEVNCSGNVEWLIDGDEDTETRVGECQILDLKTELEELNDDMRFNSTVLFLDDSHTLFVREEIPGRNVPQIRRALPFAVENYLSKDLEHTHIAHGPISRLNAIDCIAVDSETFSNILQALKLSDVYPTTCTTFGLQIPSPQEEHDVHVVKDDENAWIRTAEHLALVGIDTLPEVMTTLAGHREPVPNIRIWSYGESNSESQFFDESMYEPEIFDNRDQSLISFAVEQFDPSNCINLLQGKYSAKENATVNVRRWVMTAVFGVVCLYAYIALQASEGLWATFKVNSVQNQMKAQYVEIYQEEPRSGDIAKQMRNRLGVSGDTSREFDQLVERLAEIVALPEHSPQIKVVNYLAGRRELDVQFDMSNLEAMEAFIRSLSNDEIDVERGAIVTKESSVRANVTLTLRS